MAAVDLVAGTVMDKAAALLNDPSRTTYTYAALTPYVNTAIQELQEYFELHNASTTDQVSAVINMPTGSTAITFNAVGQPRLPDDLIEPLQLWERPENDDPFIPMTKKEFLPHSLEGTPISNFIFWTWQANEIRVLACNQDNDIKIDYTRNLFAPVVNESSIINVINGQTFLEFRVAGLAAEFIERNIPSANSLNVYADLAKDRATGITVKGKQSIMTRRRPFRRGYKTGGGIW